MNKLNKKNTFLMNPHLAIVSLSVADPTDDLLSISKKWHRITLGVFYVEFDNALKEKEIDKLIKKLSKHPLVLCAKRFYCFNFKHI